MTAASSGNIQAHGARRHRPFGLSSLRLRLLLLVLVAAIPAVVLILFTGRQQGQRAVAEAQRNALQLARFAAIEEELLIEGARQLLIGLAELPAVRRHDARACNELFTDLLKRFPIYTNIAAVTPSGDIFCRGVQGSPVNLADRPYFRRVLQTHELALSGYIIGRTSGKPNLTIAYPSMDDSGAVRAVVFVGLELSWLNHLASKARLPGGSSTLVLDENGMILARSPGAETWVGKSAPAPIVQTVLAQREGVADVPDIDGTPRLMGFVPLRGGAQAGPVYVAVGIPRDLAYATVNQLLVRTLIGLGTMLALVLLTALVGADVFVLRRVKALATAARRLGAGDLEARTGLRHGLAEFGELAQVFDQMAENIARREVERQRAERRLATQFAVTRVLAESTTVVEATSRLLPAIAKGLGWDVGEMWTMDAAANVLRRTGSWQAPEVEAKDFAEARREMTLAPGTGLVGKVWASRQPAWSSDVTTDPRFVRASAAVRAGLHAALAFPIESDGHMSGLMIFFSRDVRPPDRELLALVADLGTRIGQFMQRKRSEEEIRHQRETLYQSEKLAAMGQLLAGVAHELNNPLSVVVGRAALLRRTLQDGRLASQVQKIGDAAERCARIVKNFLALARQRPPERSQVWLNQIVQEAVELLGYALRVADVEVVLDLAENLPALWADPHQLHQVVVNLVSNAEHAMRATPPPRRLTLTTRHDPARQIVTLDVADSGPGIPPELQARIFEPFFTTKPPGEGTGLGLPLCRGIIEAHRGTITLEGRPGQGAVFRIELPVEALPETAEAQAPGVVISHRATILVVDDEPEVAGLLADALALDGHAVDTATNGAEALKKLRERRYEVLLSDIRMPGLDAPAFYAELDPELRRRIVFITGDTLSPQTKEFLERVPAPTLSKPFALDEVRRVVQRVLRSSAAGM